MSKTTKRPINIHNYFERYATAQDNHDTKLMANHYAIPCIFLSQEGSSTYTQQSKLEGLINQGKVFYKKHGITIIEPEVRNHTLIAPNIARTKVNWKYKDHKGTLLYECDYEYILKGENGDWKIEMAISVNEKERMEAWLNQKEKAASK